jgi:hypothetical protein
MEHYHQALILAYFLFTGVSAFLKPTERDTIAPYFLFFMLFLTPINGISALELDLCQ